MGNPCPSPEYSPVSVPGDYGQSWRMVSGLEFYAHLELIDSIGPSSRDCGCFWSLWAILESVGGF